MKGFIEVTERFHNGSEYIESGKKCINVKHIVLFGHKYIKTIEDVCQSPTNVFQTYDEIKELIKKATE